VSVEAGLIKNQSVSRS